jgi:hypothetical protein
MQWRRVVPDVLRNIKTWYTYYKAPQINKYGYGGQPVSKAVRWCCSHCCMSSQWASCCSRARWHVNILCEADKGNCSGSAAAHQLRAVCSMQKAISVVKKTNAYWRALETGARKNTEDKVLARK